MLHAIPITMNVDLKKAAPVVCKGAVTTTKTNSVLRNPDFSKGQKNNLARKGKERHARQYWKRDNSQIDILLASSCSHGVPFSDGVYIHVIH